MANPAVEFAEAEGRGCTEVLHGHLAPRHLIALSRAWSSPIAVRRALVTIQHTATEVANTPTLGLYYVRVSGGA